MNHHPVSVKWNRTANSATVDSTSGWRSLVGENVDFKFSSSKQHSEGKHCQLETEAIQRPRICKEQQKNTTITLQTKPTKWGNTGCRRFSKMRSIEFATKPNRGKFTFKIIFFDATIGSKNYTICKIDMRSTFPTDWGQPISLFTVLQ